ncbi:MAG: aspartate aminotransferase [Sandaracinus sp.]|nr:aspartate aminotransferase [Sandaracinus sp.]
MPRPPSFSTHIDSLSARVFSGLAAKAAAKRAAGEPVHMLSVGDTYEEPPEAARVDALHSSDLDGIHKYAPPPGLPKLLAAISDRTEALGRRVPEERLQVMSGATAGLSVISETLFDVGDEVLLPSPFWPLIRGIIAKRGAVPVQVPLFHALDSLDVEATLEAAITDRTVALYVNTPHNPTGAIASPAALDAFVRVATRHDLWLICDEAYQDLAFVDAPAPLWTRDDVQERYVACHTLSKSYGLAGARIGYAHGCAAVGEALRAVQAFSTYSAPTPMQVSAERALRTGDEFLARRRELFAVAGRETAEVLGIPAPAGGTFLFFDASPYLREGESDSLGFLGRCLDAGVLMTPGSSCGADFAKWVRICFTSESLDEHRDALERLGGVLKTIC